MTTAVLSDPDKSTLKQQITAAIAAHHAWMGRLRTAADYGRSSVDVETTAKEDVCPIGVWLTREISRVSQTPIGHTSSLAVVSTSTLLRP